METLNTGKVRLFLALFLYLTSVRAQIDYSKLTLDENYLKGSRWAIVQNKLDRLVDIYFSIEIVDIAKVDLTAMSIRVDFHLRQRWKQENLNLPEGLFKPDDPKDMYIVAEPEILQSIWSPDPFIPAARESKIASVSVKQAFVSIYQNATVTYQARLYTLLGCSFDFRWYPVDTQACSLTLESFSYSSDNVRYMWEPDKAVSFSNIKLFQYAVKLPLVQMNGTNSRWGQTQAGAMSFPFVSLKFVFDRQLAFPMIQTFIPTTLIVIMSWFSFWLGLDAIPGRIALLITCVLTLVTMHSGMQNSVPPVSYIKMMDIWMVGCMSFVFLALCEFVIVKYLHWRKQRELKAKEERDKEMQTYLSKKKEVETKDSSPEAGTSRRPNPYLDFYQGREAWSGNSKSMDPMAMMELYGMMNPYMMMFPYDNGFMQGGGLDKPRPIWVKIDRVSRALFPLSFLIFNLVFWPWLFIGAGQFRDQL